MTTPAPTAIPVPGSKTPPKTCFTTTGATATFPLLLRALLTHQFLQTLQKHGYTRLVIQHGKNGRQIYEDTLWLLGSNGEIQRRYGVEVVGFDFRERIWEEMVSARDGGGSVVSHAGSGSILEALRVGAPLLVVPNPDLMDNHQVELAEVLEAEGYVVHGRLEDLSGALERVEEMKGAARMGVWPPGKGRGSGGLVRVVREEMGWFD